MDNTKNICMAPFKEQVTQFLGSRLTERTQIRFETNPAEVATDEQLVQAAKQFMDKYNLTSFAEGLENSGRWNIDTHQPGVDSYSLRREILSLGGSYFMTITSWGGREVLGREYNVVLGVKLPYWAEAKSCRITVRSEKARWSDNPQYDLTADFDNNGDFWAEIFPQIVATNNMIASEIVPKYPFLYAPHQTEGSVPKLGTIYIHDTGTRVIKEKLFISVLASKVGTAASEFKVLSDKNERVFYKTSEFCICEIPIEKTATYLKRAYKFLDALDSAQEGNKAYTAFDRVADNYKITSDEEDGNTMVLFKPVYSREALNRLTSNRLRYNDLGDYNCYAEYKWSDISLEDFNDEMSDLIKFLDNPHNIIKRDLPEYKELWGVTWGKELTDAQKKKVKNYYVIIDTFASGVDSYSAVISNEGSGTRIYPGESSIFINPFWYLKQSKAVQIGLLRRALRDMESRMSAIDLYPKVIQTCKKAIREAINNHDVHKYEKLLNRLNISLNENTVDSKKSNILFYIIKNDRGEYYTPDNWTTILDDAEAYETRDDAEDVIAELIYNDVDESVKGEEPERYLDAIEAEGEKYEVKGVKAESFYEKGSAIKRMKDALALREASRKFVVRDVDGFYSEDTDDFSNEDIEDATVYDSLKDARAAMKDFFQGRADLLGFGRAWVSGAMNEVSFIPYEELDESKKLTESKEKDLTIDFAIPVSERGRIKANDAKKLLKYLAENKLLRLHCTYFITDVNGDCTCWDLDNDDFSGYRFSCEVTETPDGEECDVYHGLTFDKVGGKLKNFEWECYKVD